MGSNPGSRVGSQKANVRAGDQTTIIKKQYINPAGNQAAPERFVAPGTIIRGAPKIGLGAPTINQSDKDHHHEDDVNKSIEYQMYLEKLSSISLYH